MRKKIYKPLTLLLLLTTFFSFIPKWLSVKNIPVSIANYKNDDILEPNIEELYD